MTPFAAPQTTSPSYDSVTLRQRTTQPFLIPPKPGDVPSSLPRIRLHVLIEDAELRTAVHAYFDGKEPFEVVSGSSTFAAGAQVRICNLEGHPANGVPDDEIPVVLIGPDLSDDSIYAAVRSGAWAYVSEQSSGEELAAAVEQSANGQCPILRSISDRPTVAAALIKRLSRPEPVASPKTPAAPSPLNDSETEILQRVAKGQNTRRIAGDMGFQEQTIKNRITGIFNKLGPRSRAGAVAEAQRRGWL